MTKEEAIEHLHNLHGSSPAWHDFYMAMHDTIQLIPSRHEMDWSQWTALIWAWFYCGWTRGYEAGS